LREKTPEEGWALRQAQAWWRDLVAVTMHIALMV
jgi:hypothetical protein